MAGENADNDRYADALLALAEAGSELAAFEREVGAVVELLRSHEEIRRFVSDPAVKTEGKCRAIEELLAGHVSPSLVHFAFILIDRGHLLRFESISAAFYDRLAERTGKSTGELVSAHPVSEQAVGHIEREVSRILGKEVCLQVREDRGLLGGLVVRIGDFVIDGTVDHQLEQIRATLMG